MSLPLPILPVVVQTRHDGLCLVQSGNRKGWLHLKILREIPAGSGRPSPGVGRGMPIATPTSPPTTAPSSPPMTQVTMPGGGIIRRPSFSAPGVAQGVARSVTVVHDNRGYGFAMRGVTGQCSHNVITSCLLGVLAQNVTDFPFEGSHSYLCLKLNTCTCTYC